MARLDIDQIAKTPAAVNRGMATRAIHRILELSVGIPLLVIGGWGILADLMAYMWIQEDPEHRWGFVGVGTMIGILPFIMGFWLVIVAVKRSCSQSPVKSPAPNPAPPTQSN